MKKILLFINSFISICIISSACVSNADKRYIYQQSMMYTVFDIVLYSKASKNQLQHKINEIWERLQTLEYDLSPAGEGLLGKLNRNGFVSADENLEMFSILSNFIDTSKKINQKSDGAFDFTVYPLIRLWGFYQQDQGYNVPSNKKIQETLKKTGMHNIIFTNNGILLKNNVQIDIGAIAKGYAVDVALSMLKDIPEISAGFVNAGGNIKVFGLKPDGTPWKVGIRNPNGEAVQEIISLYDGEAIATSGDYEQFFVAEDGTYYHHIFNPKTGKPVSHNLASLSIVIKDSAEMADVLATTFLALGTQKTQEALLKFDPQNEFSLFFIERNGKELQTFQNDNWIKRSHK